MTGLIDPPSAETLSALAYTDCSDSELAVRHVEREAVCNLSCPTGAVVGCDPGLILDFPEPAFARRLPPGDYPVGVYIMHRDDWGPRIALAELRIADRKAARWELALTDLPPPGRSIREPQPDYSVDTGKGCFIDAATVEAIGRYAEEHPDGDGNDFIDDVIWLDGAAEYQPSFDPSLNLVAFSSGFGDGSYSSYWGFDAANETVRLVTSFGVIEEAIRRNFLQPENPT